MPALADQTLRSGFCFTCGRPRIFGYREIGNGKVEIRGFCDNCLQMDGGREVRLATDRTIVNMPRLPEVKAKRNSVPPSYEAYLNSSLWEEKRQSAILRDGGKCRICNSGANLNAHHRTYDRFGNEDIEDLTTLCRACHAWFHARERAVTLSEFLAEAGIQNKRA